MIRTALFVAALQSAAPPPLPPSPSPHVEGEVARPNTKADPTADDDTEASPERIEAARWFATGEKAFEAGDYATAAEAFAHAESLSPHPDTLYNWGLALAEAGDTMAAWHVFERLLALDTSAATLRDARHQIELLRRRLAFVSVEPTPTMPVCFDGTPLATGATRPVMPGAHEIKTPRWTKRVSLLAGRVYVIDVRHLASDPTPAPPIVPWVAVALGASATAVGLSIGASQAQERTSGRGLAFGAASVGTVALASTIVALVVHQRKPKAPREPTLRSPC